jgi:hypothetical protein
LVAVVIRLPAVFVAVKVIVYFPAPAYVCNGFCTVDVPPSPNDHAQEVGEGEDVSLNWTVRGEIPEVTFAMNVATGAERAATLIKLDCVVVLLPAEFVAVNSTV